LKERALYWRRKNEREREREEEETPVKRYGRKGALLHMKGANEACALYSTVVRLVHV
jgi:hypothetical protein